MSGHLDIARTPAGAVLLRVQHRGPSVLLFLLAALVGFPALQAGNIGACILCALAFVASFVVRRFAGAAVGNAVPFTRTGLTLIVERLDPRRLEYALSLCTGDDEIVVLERRSLTAIRAEAARVVDALHLWVEERGILPSAIQTGQ
jgi:hypothetical protein